MSGFIITFEYRMRFRSLERIIAPSILQSSKSFWDVNRALILNPPSKMFWDLRAGESNTIIAPRSDLIISSITVRSEVPGETNFKKSRNVFSFSAAMMKKEVPSIYSLCENF